MEKFGYVISFCKLVDVDIDRVTLPSAKRLDVFFEMPLATAETAALFLLE